MRDSGLRKPAPHALRAFAVLRVLRVLLVLAFLRALAIARVLRAICSAGMGVLRGPVVLLRNAADAHSPDPGAVLRCTVEASSVTGVSTRAAPSSCG